MINEVHHSILHPAPPASFPAVCLDAFSLTNEPDDTLKPPYTLNMNLSFGREFTGGWRLPDQCLQHRGDPDPKSALAAFGPEYPGGIGTRNGIRGDGVFNIDTSLAKRFLMPYSERHSLQFRWEVFNLTNTTRFDVNSASLDVAVTGTFGKYGSTLSSSRVMQFGLRYEF